MKKSIPNFLTVLRAVLTLVIIVFFFLEFPNKFLWIFGLFVLASFTDFLDGRLARKWKVESKFGRVFDSLFDKILVLSLFMLLIPYEIVHVSIFIALLLRELFVDGLKNFVLSSGSAVSPKISGKIKMWCQVFMISAMILFLHYSDSSILKNLVYLFTGFALFFAYFSAILYANDFYRFMKNEGK